MGWLAKIFGAVPKGEIQGLNLGKKAFWKVTPTKDFPSFLEAIIDLTPEGSILYLEGGEPPAEIGTFLRQHCIPEGTHVAMGTIWPRPRVFHMPITEENIKGLATLIRHHHPSGAAVHLHIYRPNEMLLEWYDSFWTDPFYLSETIQEDRLKTFCDKLALKYEKNR